MGYSPESDLRFPAYGSALTWAETLKALEVQEADTIAALYFHLAPQLGLNADLALAQAALETGWFTSERWLKHRNPAGLGITSDSVGGEDLGTMERGIKAHLMHLACYVYTDGMCPHHLLEWYDPRHFFHDGTPKLKDLKGDKHQWAADPLYIDKILRIVNSVVG